MKSADALDLITMLPLMAAERPQSDIGRPFQLQSEFRPAGDQPQAIDSLVAGYRDGRPVQTLLGHAITKLPASHAAYLVSKASPKT